MKTTKAKIKQLKEARKIERELQIELGMNFNRHRVHESKKTYNRKNLKKLFAK
jgi:hypothetical protein